MEGDASGLDKAPQRPSTLPWLAESILSALCGLTSADAVVLGGGIALKHFVDFRPTQDIDAWWRCGPDDLALADLREVLGRVAGENGLTLNSRRFGSTDSLEFIDSAGRKVFSFQIAIRETTLEDPLPSSWPPVWIETLTDNLGSKMNALVNRGAPRDFLDVHRIVTEGLATVRDCWGIWLRKNPDSHKVDAAAQIEGHLDRLEQRRPIESVPLAERGAAAELRLWFRLDFLSEGLSLREDTGT